MISESTPKIYFPTDSLRIALRRRLLRSTL